MLGLEATSPLGSRGSERGRSKPGLERGYGQSLDVQGHGSDERGVMLKFGDFKNMLAVKSQNVKD